MLKVKIENGEYIFKLDDIIKSKKISINKLIRDTNTDFKVIKRLMGNEVVRIDLTVLARFCDYLDCKISDLIEYTPNKYKTNDDKNKQLYA